VADDATPPLGFEAIGPLARVPGPPAFSRYELLGKVGEGATAVIYRARDRTLHRVLALKVLKESSGYTDLGRQRFRREAQATAGLSHPHLVTIYDVGEEEGRLYFAMELVEGRPLAELLKERKSSLPELLGIVEKAARGLGAAHKSGIVHRDVKPANILIGPGGEPKVGDFGLAHLIDSTTELTRSGVPLGTPLYMAPEQVEGRTKDISPRTDVFALGAILYEIATGRPPYGGETVVEIYSKIVRDDPAAPRRLNPELPPDLETIILKALDREPSRRYATAEALADDLRKFLDGEPVDARPASTAYRLYRRIRKYPVVYGLSVGILCLAAALSLIWVSSGRRVKSEQDVAIRTLREKAKIALDAAIDLRRSGRNDLMQRYLLVLESAYREAVARAPDVAEVEYVMGRMERMLMRDARALEYQNRALRKDPDFAPALYERIILQSKRYGGAWVGSKSPEEAERQQPTLIPMREQMLKDLGRLLQPREASLIGPAHVNAARGILAYYQSKPEEAREILEKVVQEDPLLEEGWETLGFAGRYEAFRASAEPAAAMYGKLDDHYSRAISYDRGYAPNWSGRAFVRLMRGELRSQKGENPTELLAQSKSDYSEAVRLAPDSADIAVGRAMMFLYLAGNKARPKEERAQVFRQGDEEFARALALDPGAVKAWTNRGRLRHLRADFVRRLGEDPLPDFAESERFLTESLKLLSDSRAWQFRGELRDERASHLINRGGDPEPDLEGARQDFDQAVKTAGRPAASLVQLRGLTSLRRGRYCEGKKDPASARSAYQAAAEDFREVIRLEPSRAADLENGVLKEAEQKLAELKSP
jgi:tetratricopeptide (TPR) repeat protein/tRNA A-37 threonylcarbamoyl transferase component Bud32